MSCKCPMSMQEDFLPGVLERVASLSSSSRMWLTGCVGPSWAARALAKAFRWSGEQSEDTLHHMECGLTSPPSPSFDPGRYRTLRLVWLLWCAVSPFVGRRGRSVEAAPQGMRSGVYPFPLQVYRKETSFLVCLLCKGVLWWGLCPRSPLKAQCTQALEKAIGPSLFSLLNCLFCFLPTRFPGLALTTLFCMNYIPGATSLQILPAHLVAACVISPSVPPAVGLCQAGCLLSAPHTET